jgi:hypothetical protein
MSVVRPQRAISAGVFVPPSSLDQIVVYSIVVVPSAFWARVWYASNGTSVTAFSYRPGISGRSRP